MRLIQNRLLDCAAVLLVVVDVARLAVALVLLNVTATMSSPFLDRHLLLKVLVNNLPLYGLLALGLFFALELRRARTA